MSNEAPSPAPLDARFGDESDTDDEADRLYSPRANLFGVDPEVPAPEPEPAEELPVAEAAKEKRKQQMERWYKAIADKIVVYIHVDVETGGEEVGIIQLSAVAHDSSTNIKIGRDFNEYIKPPPRITSDKWNHVAVETTGLHWNHPKIKSADLLDIVWPKWVKWCKDKVPEGKFGCRIVWNGKACDARWIFKYTEEEGRNTCQMPPRIDYFMDPMQGS